MAEDRSCDALVADGAGPESLRGQVSEVHPEGGPPCRTCFRGGGAADTSCDEGVAATPFPSQP